MVAAYRKICQIFQISGGSSWRSLNNAFVYSDSFSDLVTVTDRTCWKTVFFVFKSGSYNIHLFSKVNFYREIFYVATV